MLSMLRQKFWILNACALTRRILRNCISCRRRHEGVMNQMMGDLPGARLTPHEPHLPTMGLISLVPSTSNALAARRRSMGVSLSVSRKGPSISKTLTPSSKLYAASSASAAQQRRSGATMVQTSSERRENSQLPFKIWIRRSSRDPYMRKMLNGTASHSRSGTSSP